MFKKIVGISLVLFAVVGCADKSEMNHHKPMKMRAIFQTVDPSEAVLVQKGDEKNSCHLCGMNLTRFYKTSHFAEDNEREYQYCSIHCLADHAHNHELKNIKVVDLTTLKPISVFEAYYVVGSDVRGTMSRVSKYAFGTVEAAQAFKKEHGGEIMTIAEALKVAQKDFMVKSK